MLSTLGIAVVCYLLGSVPFPVLVSRWAMGIDLRQHGSGNMGARNAARVLGKRWFPVVFGLDFVKGAAATYLAAQFLPRLSEVDPGVAAALGGTAAVLGHCFPVFAGFRGGVGLAASAGALALISPGLLVSCGAVILLVWYGTKDLYVGVAVASLLYPVLGWFWLRSAPAAAVLAIWGVLVFALHWPDVRRWLDSRQKG